MVKVLFGTVVLLIKGLVAVLGIFIKGWSLILLTTQNVSFPELDGNDNGLST